MEEKESQRKGKVMEDDDASLTPFPLSSSASSSLCDGSIESDDGALKRKKLSKSHDHGGGEKISVDHVEKSTGTTSGSGSFIEDPLVVLGSDVMVKILNRLDAHSVANCLLVSRGWRGVASQDCIWSSKIFRSMQQFPSFREFFRAANVNQNLKGLGESILAWINWSECDELWLGKAHIPRISKVHGLLKLAAYSLSVKDGKRIRIMKEDLCDHAWEFHFTEMLPEYWLNLDPFWTGIGPPMRRYFHSDGSHTADPGDKVWGGHASCYSIITSFLADGRIREHYVRINRWPPLSVSRKVDWSWEMCNKLCVYSSIPDPEKEEGTGPLYPPF